MFKIDSKYEKKYASKFLSSAGENEIYNIIPTFYKIASSYRQYQLPHVHQEYISEFLVQ